MGRIFTIVFAGAAAGLVGIMGVAWQAYDSVAHESEAVAVSQSQQAKLDALVEQM